MGPVPLTDKPFYQLTTFCKKGGATGIVLVLQPHAIEDVDIEQT
jgi:hypothetical protein